jgi:hypothetical protein
MQHCQHCFALNPRHAERCRACQAEIGGPEAAVTTDVAEVIYVQPVTTRLEVVARPRAQHRGRALPPQPPRVSGATKYLVAIAALLIAPILVSSSWSEEGERPALMSNATGDQNLALRRAELREATAALSEQLSQLDQHLEKRWSMGDREREQWIGRWHDGLQSIKDRFHVWGTVDAHHPDARAEDALRNALLYLYSLEHVAMKDRQAATGPEYRRLRDSFEQSLVAARGP